MGILKDMNSSETAIKTPPPEREPRSHLKKENFLSHCRISRFSTFDDSQVSVKTITSERHVFTNEDKASRLLITLLILQSKKQQSGLEVLQLVLASSYSGEDGPMMTGSSRLGGFEGSSESVSISHTRSEDAQ